MPLVDYASSDEESGNESEVEENKKVIESKESDVESSAQNTRVSENVNGDGKGELFTSLPKPRKTFSFLEDDNTLSKLLLNANSLQTGKKESVKISVPSVTEFENNSEEPAVKKLKPSAKGAGLFSVLPPPKNTAVKQTNRSLVPHVLSKSQVKQPVNKTETKNKIINNVLVKGNDPDEDDEDDTPLGTSFFGSSLTQQNSFPEYLHSENSTVVETPTHLAEPGNSFINESVCQQTSNLDLVLQEDYYTNPSQVGESVSASDNPLDLDEKALQILCGNKKKRQHMPMNVIDLSGEEVLPDSKEWLLKQFTEEKRVRAHSHKKNSGPSSQSRRKHQITYLAYQAKEQELELQNQWANNRMSRKQTQSKYGF